MRIYSPAFHSRDQAAHLSIHPPARLLCSVGQQDNTTILSLEEPRLNIGLYDGYNGDGPTSARYEWMQFSHIGASSAKAEASLPFPLHSSNPTRLIH